MSDILYIKSTTEINYLSIDKKVLEEVFINNELSDLDHTFETSFTYKELEQYISDLANLIRSNLSSRTIIIVEDRFTRVVKYTFEEKLYILDATDSNDFKIACLISIYNLLDKTIVKKGVLFIHKKSVFFTNSVQYSILALISTHSNSSFKQVYDDLIEINIIEKDIYTIDDLYSDISYLNDVGMVCLNNQEGLFLTIRGFTSVRRHLL